MIAHATCVISVAIKRLDSFQVPVVTVDQPLFALGKAVGGAYDEDCTVVMLGALHIEMAVFNALGKWILGNGWTEVLTNASAPIHGCSRFFPISEPHNFDKMGSSSDSSLSPYSNEESICRIQNCRSCNLFVTCL